MANTHPEGFSRPELAEAVLEAQEARLAEANRRGDSNRKIGSRSFLVAISIIVGTILAAGGIIGVVGRAFYVTREEYTDKNLLNAEEKVAVRQTLDRLGHTMERQEAAFDKLSDAVQSVKLDMARRK